MGYLHQHGHVYAASGSNGLLKVGRTTSPEFRVYALRCMFKKKGDVLTRFWLSPFNFVADRTEQSMLKELKNSAALHSGKEWFTGADFDFVTRRLTELISIHNTALGYKAA